MYKKSTCFSCCSEQLKNSFTLLDSLWTNIWNGVTAFSFPSDISAFFLQHIFFQTWSEIIYHRLSFKLKIWCTFSSHMFLWFLCWLGWSLWSFGRCSMGGYLWTCSFCYSFQILVEIDILLNFFNRNHQNTLKTSWKFLYYFQ